MVEEYNFTGRRHDISEILEPGSQPHCLRNCPKLRALSAEAKADLIDRGAIFRDSPSSGNGTDLPNFAPIPVVLAARCYR